MLNNDQVYFSFACQVLEYHPQPWNQWVTIGDLQEARIGHAILSIGVEQLACLLSGESFNMEMIIEVIESTMLIGKQISFENDNDIIIRILFTGCPYIIKANKIADSALQSQKICGKSA